MYRGRHTSAGAALLGTCVASAVFACLSSASAIRASTIGPARASEFSSAPTHALFQDPKVAAGKAVKAGLAWLARHQSPEGAFESKKLEGICPRERPCWHDKFEATDHYDVGLTGLAISCFVRAGYGPSSKAELTDPTTGKKFAPGDVARRAIEWLRKLQKPDGSFGPDRAFMYNESIATLALAEAVRGAADESLKKSVERATVFLQGAQRPNPSGVGSWGWRYASRQEIAKDRPVGATAEQIRAELSDSDTSVTGWAIAALHAASEAGFTVDKYCWAGALDFLDSVTVTDGKVGYLAAADAGLKLQGVDEQYDYHPGTMSALAISARVHGALDLKNAFFDRAAQQIIDHLPAVSKDQMSVDYYYWYQGTLALNELDHSDRPKNRPRQSGTWNKAVIRVLLDLQNDEKDGCARGGWVTRDRWSYAGGPIYTTAMAVLALEIATAK